MARNDPQFNLRVPAELKNAIEYAAKESGRSINAEAVFRLENSFNAIDQDKLITQLIAEVGKLSRESQEMKLLYLETLKK